MELHDTFEKQVFIHLLVNKHSQEITKSIFTVQSLNPKLISTWVSNSSYLYSYNRDNIDLNILKKKSTSFTFFSIAMLLSSPKSLSSFFKNWLLQQVP